MRIMKNIQAENCRQILIMDSLSNIQALFRIYNEPQGINFKKPEWSELKSLLKKKPFV